MLYSLRHANQNKSFPIMDVMALHAGSSFIIESDCAAILTVTLYGEIQVFICQEDPATQVLLTDNLNNVATLRKNEAFYHKNPFKLYILAKTSSRLLLASHNSEAMPIFKNFRIQKRKDLEDIMLSPYTTDEDYETQKNFFRFSQYCTNRNKQILLGHPDYRKFLHNNFFRTVVSKISHLSQNIARNITVFSEQHNQRLEFPAASNTEFY